MSGMELNKIAGAVLLAGLIAMITGKVTETLYAKGGHGEAEKRGFQIAGVAAEGSGAAAPAAEPEVNILSLLPTADAKAGENVIKKCASCHDFTKGGPNKVGPNLWDIVGHDHAAKGDFNYSPALAGMKGKKWDFVALSDFLANPQKAVPGTKMGFAGIKKAQERADLLAYLRTLSDSPVAIPPAPKEEPKPEAKDNAAPTAKPAEAPAAAHP